MQATLICSDFAGATGQDYTVANADLGYRLRVQVTASNPFGQATTPSAATASVTGRRRVTTTLTARTATVCCQAPPHGTQPGEGR